MLKCIDSEAGIVDDSAHCFGMWRGIVMRRTPSVITMCFASHMTVKPTFWRNWYR